MRKGSNDKARAKLRKIGFGKVAVDPEVLKEEKNLKKKLGDLDSIRAVAFRDISNLQSQKKHWPPIFYVIKYLIKKLWIECWEFSS